MPGRADMTCDIGGEDGMDEVGVSINAVGVFESNGICPLPFVSIALVTSRERSRESIGDSRKSPLSG